MLFLVHLVGHHFPFSTNAQLHNQTRIEDLVEDRYDDYHNFFLFIINTSITKYDVPPPLFPCLYIYSAYT
jgi:hypothetical protein